MTEQWLPIAGWEGFYEVSDLGRVGGMPRTYSRDGKNGAIVVNVAGREIRPFVSNGYRKVALSRPGRKHREYVHRLVCLAFNGAAPDGHEVAHNDGDRTNCLASNLRWATRRENLADKVAHGKDQRGEKQWTAKLTETDVHYIRRNVKTEGQRGLARHFGVALTTIQAVLSGRTWGHV